MEIAKVLLPLALTVLIGGCAPEPSMNPLYTEKDVVFESSLVGAWKAVEQGYLDEEETQWTFEAAPSGAYELLREDEDLEKTRYRAHLVRLGKFLFFDAVPDPPEASEDYLYRLPAHVFGRIRIEGDTAHLSFADNEQIEKMIATKKIKLPHAEIKDFLVLTASTRELQKFAVKYAEDEEVFAVNVELDRAK